MSLEESIARLTAAVEKNNDFQEAVLAAIKAKGVQTAAPSTKDAEKAGAEDKPKATRGRAAKPKVPTVKEIQDKTLAYLEVDDDDEYDARSALVIKITEHFGVKKMSEIGDDERPAAMQMLDAAIAGDDPFEGIAEAGDEDEKPRRRAAPV